jgi:putative acetyltransferase
MSGMRNLNVTIRQARRSDLPEILKLFVETVKAVCAKDYSAEQVAVWISSIDDKERWINKLENQSFLIGESGTKILGCASLESTNYLDLLYVSKDHQGQGVASSLYHHIEAEAMSQGATVLESDVSITAKPFFEKIGFKVMSEQTKNIQGVDITNYRMTKNLKS